MDSDDCHIRCNKVYTSNSASNDSFIYKNETKLDGNQSQEQGGCIETKTEEMNSILSTSWDTSDLIMASSYSALVPDYQPTQSGSSETYICPTTVTKHVTVTNPCIPTTTATTISASPVEVDEVDKNRNESSSFITLPFTSHHGVIAAIFLILMWLIWIMWDCPKLGECLKFGKGGKGRRILHDAA